MNEGVLYDVAIVGGGLAGLSLAIQCVDKGYKVALFEKETYPFHKVCGEYISLESWDFLRRLGLGLQNLSLPIIKTLHLSDVKGKSYSFQLPLGGFGISRYSLDHSLFTMAKLKGVAIFTNSKVQDVVFGEGCFTITTSDQQVLAKVAAGCYGKRSNLDLKWKRPFTTQKANSLNNYIGIKYHVKYQHDPRSISLHNFYNGYCGISRIEDGKSCLCYLTTAENLRSHSNSIEEMQKHVLYRNPLLKEIFTSAKFLYDKPIAISQISFSKKKQVENGVLMLGDAAGMISPLCGNGMSMAMHSSKLAFESIDGFLGFGASREKMEKDYASSWQKAFSKRLWIGRTAQHFFGGDGSTAVFLKTMHAIPSLAKAVIRATHGTPF